MFNLLQSLSHRNKKIRSLDPQLIDPAEAAGVTFSTGTESSTDEADILDMSYEDALFDSELRTFVHSEYDTAEPTSNAYSRLFKTIEQYESGSNITTNAEVANATSLPESRLPLLLVGSLGKMRRYLGGATLVRIFPSLVAFLLVFSALGPSVAALLDSRSPYLGQPSLYSRPDYANPALLTSIGEKADRKSSSAEQPPVYNPNYDPDYDAPETWTPMEISQIKFAADGSSPHRNGSDTRRLDAGPK